MRNPGWFVLLTLSLACGFDETACDPLDPGVCGPAQVCAAIPDGGSACVDAYVIQGVIYDALTSQPIEGARVVGLGADGAPRSGVAFSEADGSYTLPVGVPRAADGTPTGDPGLTTLRVDGAGYQTFPLPPRVALPIELTQSEFVEGAGYVVASPTTDVALIPVPALGDTIHGRVDHEIPGGILVVASQVGQAASTSITDKDGYFHLFNVPPGRTTLSGYHAGIQVVPQEVTAPAVDVLLTTENIELATVSGSINIVNAGGGLETSVILVPAETFDADAARGEVPRGLRVAPVSGEFEILQVPTGRYAVLAAFENDSLVRDPDESIAGTNIVFVDVATADVVLESSFKVTEALDVLGPGADALEAVTVVPTLRWADDSSEDGYEVRVYDALGNLVHENLDVPRVTGSDSVEYAFSDTLEEGMVYQFRAQSWREAGGVRTYISATEDLLGVFAFQP